MSQDDERKKFEGIVLDIVHDDAVTRMTIKACDTCHKPASISVMTIPRTTAAHDGGHDDGQDDRQDDDLHSGASEGEAAISAGWTRAYGAGWERTFGKNGIN